MNYVTYSWMTWLIYEGRDYEWHGLIYEWRDLNMNNVTYLWMTWLIYEWRDYEWHDLFMNDVIQERLLHEWRDLYI